MKKYRVSLVLFVFVAGCTSTIHHAVVRDITKNTKAREYYKKISYRDDSAYIVESGDTLYEIAWKRDLSVDDIAFQNNLKAPYVIKKGQVLNLKENQLVKQRQYSDQSPKNSKKPQKRQQNVEPKKAKSYSNGYRKSEKNIHKIVVWTWPSNGKLVKRFSSSDTALQGIRIIDKRGSAVNAAADGKVVYVGSGLRGYGKLLIIKHNNDYLSAYAHNDKLLVKENQNVKKGQKIALMGDTGASTVYLHFEIRYKGKSVDPLRYLPKR